MSKLIRTYWMATIINIILLSLLYVCFPDLRPSLRYENQFLENLTAIFYLQSLIVSTLFLIRLKSYFWGYLAIPLISLINFLDEISLYSGILKAQVPKVYGVPVGKRMVIRGLSLMMTSLEQNDYAWIAILLNIFASITIFILIYLLAKNNRCLLEYISNIVNKYLPLRFLFFGLLCGVVAQIIDGLIVDRFGVDYFIEELLEMNASLSFLFASFALKYSGQVDR